MRSDNWLAVGATVACKWVSTRPARELDPADALPLWASTTGGFHYFSWIHPWIQASDRCTDATLRNDLGAVRPTCQLRLHEQPLQANWSKVNRWASWLLSMSAKQELSRMNWATGRTFTTRSSSTTANSPLACQAYSTSHPLTITFNLARRSQSHPPSCLSSGSLE